jgi:hypothetical protein
MNKPGNKLESNAESGVVNDPLLTRSSWVIGIGGFFSLGRYRLAELAVSLYVASIGINPF